MHHSLGLQRFPHSPAMLFPPQTRMWRMHKGGSIDGFYNSSENIYHCGFPRPRVHKALLVNNYWQLDSLSKHEPLPAIKTTEARPPLSLSPVAAAGLWGLPWSHSYYVGLPRFVVDCAVLMISVRREWMRCCVSGTMLYVECWALFCNELCCIMNCVVTWVPLYHALCHVMSHIVS